MRKVLLILSMVLFGCLYVSAQTQPIEIPEGYRFQHRIKGPKHKKSKILEIMVDEYGNYLVATFRGEKSKYIYLVIYRLYTWEELYSIKLDDNRCELYNSSFSEDGNYLYINYDIYRNRYKELNLETKEIREVDCSATPKGCRKIEPQLYKVDGYTVGEIFYLFRDMNFENYIRIYVKKEMYIPKSEEDEDAPAGTSGLKNAIGIDPTKGGIVLMGAEDIQNLRQGMEIEKEGIKIFYDSTYIKSKEDTLPLQQTEGEMFKVRLSDVELKKLERNISFVQGNFVFKVDLDSIYGNKK